MRKRNNFKAKQLSSKEFGLKANSEIKWKTLVELVSPPPHPDPPPKAAASMFLGSLPCSPPFSGSSFPTTVFQTRRDEVGPGPCQLATHSGPLGLGSVTPSGKGVSSVVKVDLTSFP